MSKLRISRENYDKIIRHCMDELPNEACGLLAGMELQDLKTVKKIYPVVNADRSPEHFSIDVRDIFAVTKAARAENMSVIGNFHSHPCAPALPSKEDKRLAYNCKMEYLIVSLQEVDNPVLKAFGIDEEKNVTVHEIEIV